MELLTLSDALNPIDGFKSFSINFICILVEKFYPLDFTKNDLRDLRRQLDHYKYDIIDHLQFHNIASLFQLCQLLVETKKLTHYFLIDRLIYLFLTIPVYIATTERDFSGMKLIKNLFAIKWRMNF